MAERPHATVASVRGALALGIAGCLVSQFGCSDEGNNLALVRPAMVLDPAAGSPLDFAEVVIGRGPMPDPVLIHVGNVGDGILSLSRVTIEGMDADVFEVSSFPKTVRAGETRDIYVRFAPTAKVQASATLHIFSNDPTTPEATYPLAGPAREPCHLTFSPAYSVLKLGEQKTLTLSAGVEDCKVTYVFTDENVFPLIDPPALPVTIPGGGSLDLRVKHAAPAQQQGVPIRQVMVRESEGTEVSVSLEGEPPLSGCLERFPNRLLFGEVSVGHTAVQSATVLNHCGREAWVTAAVVTIGTYYYSVDEAAFPLRVSPNGQVSVPIIYSPFNPLGDEGTVVLFTNDLAASTFGVDLYGTAAVPQIAYFPPALDFGTVVFQNPVGSVMRSECSSTAQFVEVYNVGDAPLSVRGLSFDLAGDADFEVVDVLIDGQAVADVHQPFVIPAGQEAKIVVQFFPTRSDPPEHASTLVIAHDAAGSPSRVAVRGRGVRQGSATDTFTQLSGPKVDILWVIDSSGSMSNKQALLVQNMSQFVGYADSVNADYQMAVVETDGHSPNAGVFRHCYPYPRIIRSGWGDEMSRQDAFRCLFTVGVNGPANEAGLGAAYFALLRATSPDENPVSNPNTGFVRPDANLVVVVVSDEDDQSDQGQELLRDYYLSIHGSTRPDRVKFHAIAGPVSEPCRIGTNGAEPGYHYYWMAQQLGGLYLDICNTDWQPLLTNLGINTFQPLAEWTLAQPADPASVSVSVNGVSVARGATNGFVYNPSANSVRFNGTAVPPPGATITVDYSGLCRP